jgi:hypothetical protein
MRSSAVPLPALGPVVRVGWATNRDLVQILKASGYDSFSEVRQYLKVKLPMTHLRLPGLQGEKQSRRILMDHGLD